MAVNKELWIPAVVEYFFKTNQFANFAVNEDEYVVGGSIVHIPNAGAPSGTERNRVVLPAAINRREDLDVTYELDEFTSDPALISNRDKVELSYDKTASQVRQDTQALQESAGDWLLYKWLQNIPAANKILSTGANATATAPGATGNRKIITEADLRKAKVTLDNQKVPKMGRYMLLSSNLMDQLISDEKLRYAFANPISLEDGTFPRYAGFTLLDRADVGVQATGGTAGVLKAPGAASATTDDEVAFFWQVDSVSRAMGTVDIFQDLGNPVYYGDIYSFLMRLGGRNRRYDNKGVGTIVVAP